LQEPFNLILDVVKKLNLSNKQNLNNNFESKKGENKLFNNSIKFKEVSYNYTGSKMKAVNDVTIEISKGTSVGIIGRSGAGKSTLVDIILGLLKPKSGEIIFDGENVDIKKNIWQTQIGYVPQNIYLLDDTIKNNIIFGINEDDIDELLLAEVIEMAQLKSLVNSLPDNINSIVGNRGAKLSGGERQRIGIARALYNEPKILVLDEATSSLDMDNENKILNEIYQNKKDKTLIIISHRNNTVKYCDSIYVMENGKVIDNGSFQKIMKKYSHLSEK
jgi:ATP-binding cassette subfamily C protein